MQYKLFEVLNKKFNTLKFVPTTSTSTSTSTSRLLQAFWAGWEEPRRMAKRRRKTKRRKSQRIQTPLKSLKLTRRGRRKTSRPQPQPSHPPQQVRTTHCSHVSTELGWLGGDLLTWFLSFFQHSQQSLPLIPPLSLTTSLILVSTVLNFLFTVLTPAAIRWLLPLSFPFWIEKRVVDIFMLHKNNCSS